MDRNFGNYILHERIGIGGMGEVFRATKQGPDGFEVQVALKVILPDLAKEASFQKRFSREARLAASLKHPNIVQVNGFDIINAVPFIEMEYIHGTDLRRILRALPRGEKLPLEESLAILYAVARGLTHAHHSDDGDDGERGIIHCDLNPHNIIISTLGEVKIADFGIARAMRGDAAASATVRGKLAYMSPEQMDGRKLDRHTDLFSFGILAYQLLSGGHPFERGSEGATIAAIGKTQCVPLSDPAPGLPATLYELVAGLLSLEPRQRPDNAPAILEPLVFPSAVTSLAGRVRRALASEKHGTFAAPPAGSPTAATIPGGQAARLWPYLAAGVAGIALVAGAFFLPAGLEPAGESAAGVSAVKPASDFRSHETQEAPPLKHSLTLESDPPGADILADGVPIGITPVTVRSGPDGSMPELEARLYRYHSRRFRIPSGTGERFVVDLEPLSTGILRISARPWARVSFRGKDAGETPVTLENLPVGKETVTLSYGPDNREWSTVLHIREGLNTLSVDMREIREP